MKTGRSSCSSRTRIRALTAVWVRLRLAAALTKLPVLTTSRNVRATLISILQFPDGQCTIIFIFLLHTIGYMLFSQETTGVVEPAQTGRPGTGPIVILNH